MIDSSAWISRLNAEGILVLDVKVIPRASRSEVVDVMEDGAWKVKIAAVPEKGRANEELKSLLGKFFNTSKGGIAIVSGETSQRKRVKISRCE